MGCVALVRLGALLLCVLFSRSKRGDNARHTHTKAQPSSITPTRHCVPREEGGRHQEDRVLFPTAQASSCSFSKSPMSQDPPRLPPARIFLHLLALILGIPHNVLLTDASPVLVHPACLCSPSSCPSLAKSACTRWAKPCSPHDGPGTTKKLPQRYRHRRERSEGHALPQLDILCMPSLSFSPPGPGH